MNKKIIAALVIPSAALLFVNIEAKAAESSHYDVGHAVNLVTNPIA